MNNPGNGNQPPTWQQNLFIGFVAAVAVFAFRTYNEPNAMVPKAMVPEAVSPQDTPKAIEGDIAGSVDPNPMPPLDPRYQEKPFPSTGEIEWLINYDPNTPLGEVMILDLSKIDKNKVVRIRNGFNQPVAQAYMRSGEGLRVMLPHGSYAATIAIGDAWYGPDIHFGASGRYLDMENIESTNGIFTTQILPPDPLRQGMRPIAGSNF